MILGGLSKRDCEDSVTPGVDGTEIGRGGKWAVKLVTIFSMLLSTVERILSWNGCKKASISSRVNLGSSSKSRSVRKSDPRLPPPCKLFYITERRN